MCRRMSIHRPRRTELAIIHFTPYFALDTDGVHFEVCVDGKWSLAHVGRPVLERRYGLTIAPSACLAVFHQHIIDIVEAAEQRIKFRGAETVILQVHDLSR